MLRQAHILILVNKKDSKFEVGHHVRISSYNKILQKVTLQIGL